MYDAFSHLIKLALGDADDAQGVIDGQNTVFTFDNPPGIVIKNGAILRVDSDYSVMGNQVTLGIPLYEGDQLISY